MDTTQVSTFFALLAVVAAVAALGGIGLAVAWRGSDRLAVWRSEYWPQLLLSAALVSAVATLGSLYLSEVAHFTPCPFCWFQRIFMYPLAVITTLAWFRRDPAVRAYGLALAGIGGCISIYHCLIEIFPQLDPETVCGVNGGCSLSPVTPLGGIATVPRMALCGFAAAFVFLALMPRSYVSVDDATLAEFTALETTATSEVPPGSDTLSDT